MAAFLSQNFLCRTFDGTIRSLRADPAVTNAPGRESICDGLLVPTPGALTLLINRERLAGGFVVDDDATAEAMAAAFRHLKVVAEPSGAAALAAAFRHLKVVAEPSGAVALAVALTGRFDCRGKTVCVVCSGGNVGGGAFYELTEQYL